MAALLVQIKSETFVDKLGITRPMPTELRKWRRIDVVATNACNHFDSACELCVTDWKREFNVRDA